MGVCTFFFGVTKLFTPTPGVFSSKSQLTSLLPFSFYVNIVQNENIDLLFISNIANHLMLAMQQNGIQFIIGLLNLVE